MCIDPLCPPSCLVGHPSLQLVGCLHRMYSSCLFRVPSFKNQNQFKCLLSNLATILRRTLRFMIAIADTIATSSLMPRFVDHSNVGLIVLLDRQRQRMLSAEQMIHRLRKLMYLMPPSIFEKTYSYLSYFLTRRPFLELVVPLSSRPICSFCASKSRATRKAFSDILIPIQRLLVFHLLAVVKWMLELHRSAC